MLTHPVKNEKIQSYQDQFNFALFSLGFGTLGVSFFYSTQMGYELKYVLIFSWMALFLSLLLGGWRMLYTPKFYKIEEELPKAEEAEGIFRTHVLVWESLEEVGEDQKKNYDVHVAELAKAKKKLENLQKQFSRLKRRFAWFFRFQILFFILGIFLTGVFVTVNYLHPPADDELPGEYETI